MEAKSAQDSVTGWGGVTSLGFCVCAKANQT